MDHKNHLWRLGEDPPSIRPHSLAKHRVLKSYLERYVAVLTANPRQEQLRLTLVDGFAGGGRYLDARTKEERPGSPLIMLDAMRSAEAIARQCRSKPFNLDVDYFFIEKAKDSLDYLRSVIAASEYSHLLEEGKVRLLQNTFETQVPEILDHVEGRGRAGRAIFFLDQFGYTDVPLGTIRAILAKLDNAEVILTFATDFLIDYLTTNETTQQILNKIGIVLPPQAIRHAKDEPSWRRSIQLALHREIPEKTGAKYYTPFFIRSTDSHRDFWLIHLSGHFRARDVMVGLHWQESTSFAHYGRPGLRMLGYDQANDQALSHQPFLPGFFFDDTALALSRQDLTEQLPERVRAFQDGIPFRELFALLTNETPVTSDIMKGVLNDLTREGVIRVRDKSGVTIRRSGIQNGGDIVIPKKNRQLFLPTL